MMDGSRAKQSKDRQGTDQTGRGVERSPASGLTGPLANLLALQRTAGNRVVSQLLNQESPILQRKCDCGGTCTHCRSKISILAETGLRVNQPGDRFEREADQAAAQVMRSIDPVPPSMIGGPEILQRKCADCAGGKGLCPKCAQEEERIQRKPANGSGTTSTPGLANSIRPLLGGGTSLPTSIRSQFEARFNHDFSDVRIHTGQQAADTARALNAQAFTLGRNVVFGAGQYTPESRAGRWLLAHELTHVIQQSTSGASRGPIIQRQATPDLSSLDEALEQDRHVKTPGLIVENTGEDVLPSQMTKAQFLEQLEKAVCQTAESVLRSMGRTTKDCPYLAYWFVYYGKKSSRHIERAIHKYAPEASKAASAAEYISIVTSRVRESVKTWAKTGEISGIPPELKNHIYQPGLPQPANGRTSSDEQIQAKAQTGGLKPAKDPASVRQRLGRGRSLDSGVRSRLEPAFGTSFAHVRLHTDPVAARLSDDLNARAFTVGKHVAFGRGEYRPGTLMGDALIAHELAHTIQQGNGGPDISPLEVGSVAYKAHEEEADWSAMAAVASLFSGAQASLKDIAQKALPRLRSGLSIQSCGHERCPPGKTYFPKAGMGIGNLGPGLCRWECWTTPPERQVTYSGSAVGKAPPRSVFDYEPQSATTKAFFNANTNTCFCFAPEDKDTGEALASNEMIDCDSVGIPVGGKRGRRGKPSRPRTRTRPPRPLRGRPPARETVPRPTPSKPPPKPVAPPVPEKPPVEKPAQPKAPVPEKPTQPKAPTTKKPPVTKPTPATPTGLETPVTKNAQGKLVNPRNQREVILEEGVYKYRTGPKGTGKGAICFECNPQYYEFKGGRWRRRPGVKLPSEQKKSTAKELSFDSIKGKNPVPVDPKVPASRLGLDQQQLSKFQTHLDNAGVNRVLQKKTHAGIKAQLAEEVVSRIGTQEAAGIQPKKGGGVRFFRGDQVAGPAPKRESKGAERAQLTDGLVGEVYQQGGKPKLHIHRIYEVKSGTASSKELARQGEWDIERIKEVGVSIQVPKPGGGTQWQKFEPQDITMQPRAQQAEFLHGFTPAGVKQAGSKDVTRQFKPRELPEISEADLNEAALMVLRQKTGG